MKNNINAIKLIIKNGIKFIPIFLIVLILMTISTYLTVQAPKLMGESFNSLGQYIAFSVADKKINEVEDLIQNNQEITQADKDYIVEELQLNQEQIDQLNQLSTEQIKQQQKITNLLNSTILLDKEYVEKNGTFNEAQIENIKNSDLNNLEKMMILNLPNDQLKSIASNIIDFNQKIEENHKNFNNFIIKLLLCFVFLGLGMMTYTLLFVNVTVGITKNLRNNLFDKIINLSIRFYDKSNTGDLLSRFTNDIENITMFLNSAFIQALSSIFMLFGVCIMMWNEDTSSVEINNFIIQKPLFWTILIFGIIAILISFIIIRLSKKYVSKQQQKLGLLNGFIDESLSGQKEIISYNLKDQIINDFEKYNEDFKDNATKGLVYSGLLMPLIMGIGLIALGIIVFVGSDLVIQAIFSVGLLIAFIQYSQQFFNNFASAVSQYNMVELGMSGANRVQEVLDEKEEVINVKNPQLLNTDFINIKFDHVNFGYDENKPVLKDINIEVNNGEMVALVGPTGSGKTTIMNLLNRFYDVTSGSIKINDIDIRDYEIDNLRKNIGLVLQDSILFKGTIAENIKFGKPEATMDEIINACKITNIHDFIMNLEDGYDTIISDKSNVFSTGQKQLISIARTIIVNPTILILDEATSNVDTITEAKIQKAMDAVIKGRTSFVIAHRLKTILKANKILVINNGQIIEEGDHKQLLALNGFYAELYKNQFVE